MCGIAGIVDTRGAPAAPIQTEILDRLRHRGPDAEGRWMEPPAVLLHTRLSIIDLTSAGAQPMVSPDGRHVLVYNGEIYNHAVLREELCDSWVFRGRSDTEVLLAALARWGAAAVRRLNGMYAFALWDRRQRELLLCRDPVGIKPLFYSHRPGQLAFGSEIKALAPLWRGFRVDYPSLHEFVFFGAPLGRNTLYQEVWQLLPGEMLRYRPDEDRMERWQEVEIADSRIPVASGNTSAESLQSGLRKAVEAQMVADVPVGVLLSGGLDSSTITAFASDRGRRRINTYSLGFDDASQPSELPKARLVAERFRTAHHEEIIGVREVLPVLERMVEIYDGPFSDAANLPLYLLYGRLRGQCKVVLQGDGGDEVFAGYLRYQALAWLSWWQRFAPSVKWLSSRAGDRAPVWWQRLARFTAAIGNDDPALRMAYLLTVETNHPSPLRLLSPGLRQELRRHDPFQRYRELQDRFRDLDPVQAMLWTDCKILLPDIFLIKVDRASMAQGVEVRVPLLDLDLMRLALPLPSRKKIAGGRSKALLREAMRDLLPAAILRQPKAGFGVPYGEWLRGGLCEPMQSILLDDSLRWADVFDRPALELCIKQHVAGERNFGFLLWKMMNLALWLNKSKVAWT